MKKKKRIVKSIVLTVVILVVCVGFLFTGYYLGVKNSQLPGSYQLINVKQNKPQDLDFSIFWKTWNEVHQRYVYPDKIDDKELVEGAIKGMVSALDDPYSVFMPPSQSEVFDQDLEGSFGGVGIMVELKEGQLVVSSPLEDGPAIKKGIEANDVITKIDGQSTEGLNFDQMISKIRGKIGTEVKLTIYRPSIKEEREFVVKREKIEVESVKYRLLDEGVGYLKINQYGNDTVDLLNKKASRILADESKAIVIDLRNNPGGFLDVAVKTTSLFIEDGLILKQVSKNESKDFEAIGNAKLKDYQLAVLINGGSASAAEIMAGALRDQKDSVLIGEKTFGKGSVQDLVEVSNWGNLRITSGKWQTPSGEMINGKGIKPDIKIESSVKNFGSKNDKALNRALKYLENN